MVTSSRGDVLRVTSSQGDSDGRNVHRERRVAQLLQWMFRFSSSAADIPGKRGAGALDNNQQPMPRFRFRLQTLLHYRQHLVEQTEQALARLNAEEHALLDALERCQAELQRGAIDSASIKAHHLQAYDAYRQQLVERIRMLERQLLAVRAERDREQERLVERLQDCDVLERLRQRQHQEYLHAERRHEQSQLDEIAARQRRSPAGSR